MKTSILLSSITLAVLALTPSFLHSAEAERPAKKRTIEWNEIDATEFSARLDQATASGEKWAANPETIIVEFAGPFVAESGEKMGQSRTIRLISKGEDLKTLSAVLSDDGLFDDSTKTARLRLVLTRTTQGAWKLRKAFQSSEKWSKP